MLNKKIFNTSNVLAVLVTLLITCTVAIIMVKAFVAPKIAITKTEAGRLKMSGINSEIEARIITKAKDGDKLEVVTVGGGCFWCVEAIFERIEGCVTIVSGYAGGSTPNPTYQTINTGSTGHAEVIQITFLPEVISYEEIIRLFFYAHNPSTLNRQGNDVGTQYRSIILAHDDKQLTIAQNLKNELNNDKKFLHKPIVTEIKMLDKFYKAETYHQDYYDNNRTQSYCAYVITPKVTKAKMKVLRANKQKKNK